MIPVKELFIIFALVSAGWAVIRIGEVYRFYYCNDASGTFHADFGDRWNVTVTGYKPGFEPQRKGPNTED